MKIIFYCIFVGFGIFFNSVKADDRVYFSRANCALPQDIFSRGTRNESITWSPRDFYSRAYTLTSNWKYYEIYTGSGHYQRGRRRHYYSNYEFFGIHSDITHIDYVSQSLWGVKGQHAYRGPYYSHNKFLPRRESFYRTPDTEATDCNLKVSQFFGNRR
jgi:hypothetical protein